MLLRPSYFLCMFFISFYKRPVDLNNPFFKFSQVLRDIHKTTCIFLFCDRLPVLHHFAWGNFNPPDRGVVEDQRVIPNDAIKYNSPKPYKAPLPYPAGSVHNTPMSKGRAAAHHHLRI